MNRKDAEKLADEIFDMIDRNYPRGLIKSDLTDLLAKFEPGCEDAKTPPDANDWDWIPIKDLVEEAKKALRSPGYAYISTTGTSPKIYSAKTESEIEADKKALSGLGYYFPSDSVNHYFTKDPCDND